MTEYFSVVQFRPFWGNTGEREQTAQAGGLESCTVELRRAFERALRGERQAGASRWKPSSSSQCGWA